MAVGSACRQHRGWDVSGSASHTRGMRSSPAVAPVPLQVEKGLETVKCNPDDSTLAATEHVV